jgi:hypothetical protein
MKRFGPGSCMSARYSKPGDGPSGQDGSKTRHVGLRVAGRNAERMEFQKLPPQILVQPAVLLTAYETVGTNGRCTIQVIQHGGMPHDRFGQILEPSGHVRTDRFMDVSTDQAHCPVARAFTDREMIGPEPHQALTKRHLGGDRMA